MIDFLPKKNVMRRVINFHDILPSSHLLVAWKLLKDGVLPSVLLPLARPAAYVAALLARARVRLSHARSPGGGGGVGGIRRQRGVRQIVSSAAPDNSIGHMYCLKQARRGRARKGRDMSD